MSDRNDPERKADTTLDPAILDDITRRVVEVARPQQIILFGPAARGDMNRHSGMDLVIVKDGVHRGTWQGGYTKTFTASARRWT